MKGWVALILSVALMALAIASPQVVPNTERDHNVDITIGIDRTRAPLRTLLARPGFSKSLESAYAHYKWLLCRYSSMLQPFLLGGTPWHLIRVEIDERRQQTSFAFLGYVTINVSSTTGRINYSNFRLMKQDLDRLRAEAATPVSDAELESVAREMALVTNALNPSAQYRLEKRTFDNGKGLNFIGYLPGTNFKLGPEFQVRFDEVTGLPLNASFKYAISPYEPPFKTVLTKQGATVLALPFIVKNIDWPVFRLSVSNPYFDVPDNDGNPLSKSPRHRALIAQKRRCLTTGVTVLLVKKDNRIPETRTWRFDSQTHELVSMGRDVFGPQNNLETDVLDPKQMIALPNLALQIPVVPVKSEEKVTNDRLKKVLVRQDAVTFSAKLDREKRVIWIEGRPYQATRAFTAALLKLFPD